MKKLILTLTVLTITISGFSKFPVISRTTSGGGFWGYAKTEAKLVEYTWGGVNNDKYTTRGWVIKCEGDGNEHCPKHPGVAVNGDDSNPTDKAQGDALLDYAYSQIEMGNFEGNSSTTVQVVGETFKRVYTLHWITDDADLTNSNITVDCEYVDNN